MLPGWSMSARARFCALRRLHPRIVDRPPWRVASRTLLFIARPDARSSPTPKSCAALLRGADRQRRPTARSRWTFHLTLCASVQPPGAFIRDIPRRHGLRWNETNKRNDGNLNFPKDFQKPPPPATERGRWADDGRRVHSRFSHAGQGQERRYRGLYDHYHATAKTCADA
jgi:hypothetical protein